MAAGTALNSTITSSDTSGNTCLVYVPNGSNSGSPCTYPAPGSTPAPVTIKAVGDGYAIQWNQGPTNLSAPITIAGTNAGTGNTAPTSASLSPPPVAIGHTSSGTAVPVGGGIVYSNGTIYFTQNSLTSPIGEVAYANGAAATSVTNMTVAGLTGAPAGGLILGPDGNLWGTEQNANNVFKVSTSGGAATEVAISCPSGSSGDNGAHSGVLGPQTGIATDGTNVYVLCADVSNHSNQHNVVTTINPSTDASTSCNLASSGGTSIGSFSNGAVVANGTIYTANANGGGNGAGGANIGHFLSFPVGNCGQFTEAATQTNGDGNVALLADGNLYSEADGFMMSASFANATAANPAWDGITNVSPPGGGGLVQDTVLGSKAFFGTASGHDLDVHTAWTGGTDLTSKVVRVPLTVGGTAVAAGDCEVAFNSGGGFGIIQLPDGRIAWNHNTDGLETTHNWLCIATP